MGLSRTISEIYGDFHQKSQNFCTPFYFASPMKGFPLELGTGAGSQRTRMMEAIGPTKKFGDIFNRLNMTDGWKDGHQVTAKTVLMYSVAQ